MRFRLAITAFLLFVAIAGCDDPTAPLRDLDSTSNRVAGHEHRATLRSGLIDAPPATEVQLETTPASYAAGAVPEHAHIITLLPTDLAVLQQPGGRADVVSSENEGHDHVFVFSR
jgi:hypothetical protein